MLFYIFFNSCSVLLINTSNIKDFRNSRFLVCMPTFGGSCMSLEEADNHEQNMGRMNPVIPTVLGRQSFILFLTISLKYYQTVQQFQFIVCIEDEIVII